MTYNPPIKKTVKIEKLNNGDLTWCELSTNLISVYKASFHIYILTCTPLSQSQDLFALMVQD